MRAPTTSLLVAALLCALVLAPGASAAYDPLASGSATLTLEKPFAAYLNANGIELTATAPAKRRGQRLLLPAQSGEWDPTTGKGTIEAEGAVVFQRERKKVPLREIVIKAKRTPLYAKVGGGQLKVASAQRIATAREGFGARLTATKLALSEKVATRLNKKLRPAEPFEAGQVIGTLLTRVQPQTVTVLAQNKATLLPDPAILAKLDQLHVSLNPVSPAELAPGPLFSFPIIAGGQIAPDASLGTLRTGGDLEFLQLGAGQIFWHEQWLELAAKIASAEANIQPSPPYPGKQGRLGVLGLDLATATVYSDPGARTVSVSGAALALSAATAAAFNEAFAAGKAVFAAGERLGSVSFVAQGQ
jgi:hypothetical protein